jgi:hypothetical protein
VDGVARGERERLALAEVDLHLDVALVPGGGELDADRGAERDEAEDTGGEAARHLGPVDVELVRPHVDVRAGTPAAARRGEL